MEGRDSKKREDIFSKPVRAGKRTYFFDVKATRSNDYYLTITESKRRIDDSGKFNYDKHKLFLYKEDFEKFANGLQEVFDFIKNEKGEDYGVDEYDVEEQEYEESSTEDTYSPSKEPEPVPSALSDNYTSDISFDDLEDEDK